MKYAFFIFFFIFFTAPASYARTINSFNDSQALVTIAEFMKDVSSDLPTSFRISDKKLKLSDTSNCVDSNTASVTKAVESAIMSVLRFYPDEELPVEEAMNDLADYLGSRPFKKCEIEQSNLHTKIKSAYYFDSSDSIHIKVDTITLLVE